MKVVVQRVSQAEVRVEGKAIGRIGRGMLIFIGVGKDDTEEDAVYLAQKVAQLRMFEDGNGKMNLSSSETGGQALVVSQFTLYGNCRKGRRPSFDAAAGPQKGEQLYSRFVQELRGQNIKVETGQFRATMDVALTNDGPVTFIIESKSDN